MRRTTVLRLIVCGLLRGEIALRHAKGAVHKPYRYQDGFEFPFQKVEASTPFTRAKHLL
jgi:hypothetical protein